MITTMNGVVGRQVDLIANDGIRGYNDLMILAVLKTGDSYGYQVARRIQIKARGQYEMHETTLYSACTRLVKAGYLLTYPGEISYGRARTYYHLTDSGKLYLAAKSKEWQLTKQVVDQFIDAEAQK